MGDARLRWYHVNLDLETIVSNDYTQGNNAFTGKINKVTISVK